MSNKSQRSMDAGEPEGSPRALKIGEVSQITGVGVEALRFYERNGLLERPPRTGSGYRAYSEDVLERIAFIRKAQVLGFSLDEIRRVIEDASLGQSPCEEVREIVRLRLEELDERMREMHRYRNELAETLAEWERVGRAPGHICGLIEGAEIKHSAGRPKELKKGRPTKGKKGHK